MGQSPSYIVINVVFPEKIFLPVIFCRSEVPIAKSLIHSFLFRQPKKKTFPFVTFSKYRYFVNFQAFLHILLSIDIGLSLSE